MEELVQSPGTVLTFFLRAHHLNPTSLAKAIKMSQTSVRLMTLDKTRISAPVAIRLGKVFSIKPEYWLKLQIACDLAEAEADEKFAAVLKSIPAVGKPTGKNAKKAPAKKAK